jgi:cell division protein FtsW
VRELSAGAVRLQLVPSLRSPRSTSVLLLGTTLFLTGFGVLMVLSSSSIESHHDSDSFFTRFSSQLAFAVIGVAVMLLVARFPLRTWRRASFVVLAVSCVLQLVAILTPLGVKIGDNTNWLRIGPFTGQPSEGIKVGLVLWLAFALGSRKQLLHDWRNLTRLVLPVAGSAILVVLLGGDLGTTVIMSAFTLGALFFAGARLRHLAVVVVVGAIAAVTVALSSESRRGRISAFFGGTSAVNPDVNWQLDNAHYALATGGLWGVGLGHSRSKWFWLPSADTDFIFAVIGEELGLIGGLLVLGLYSFLTWLLLRILVTAADPTARIVTGTVLVWLIGQAFVNIGVVLGLIPVLGVPLPFISAGGTALIASLLAVGLTLAAARHSAPAPEGSP